MGSRMEETSVYVNSHSHVVAQAHRKGLCRNEEETAPAEGLGRFPWRK